MFTADCSLHVDPNFASKFAKFANFLGQVRMCSVLKFVKCAQSVKTTSIVCLQKVIVNHKVL